MIGNSLNPDINPALEAGHWRGVGAACAAWVPEHQELRADENAPVLRVERFSTSGCIDSVLAAAADMGPGDHLLSAPLAGLERAETSVNRPVKIANLGSSGAIPLISACQRAVALDCGHSNSFTADTKVVKVRRSNDPDLPEYSRFHYQRGFIREIREQKTGKCRAARYRSPIQITAICICCAHARGSRFGRAFRIAHIHHDQDPQIVVRRDRAVQQTKDG